MDFDLSEDQVALRDGARDLLDSLAGPGQVRQVVESGSGLDRDLWTAMAAQGWPAVEVPEDQGGLGLGLVEAAVLCEEIGRHVAPAPFLTTILAMDAICGSESQDESMAKWRERLIGGGGA